MILPVLTVFVTMFRGWLPPIAEEDNDVGVHHNYMPGRLVFWSILSRTYLGYEHKYTQSPAPPTLLYYIR